MKRIWLSAMLVLGVGYAATLPYQGLATDAKKNPKADGFYAAVFSLYSASTGGTALWSESQSVSTTKGRFSTTLGSIVTIPDNLFQGSTLYLGVKFDGGFEGGRVLLGTAPWATAVGKSSTSAFADSAGKVAGLSDSMAVARSMLASQVDSMKALRDAAAAQGAAIVSKDSVGTVHIADSAKVTAGLNDSVRALRLAIVDSTGRLRNGLADSALSLRTNTLGDSLVFLRANVYDTAETLRARIKDSSLVLRATIGDSTVSLRIGLMDTAKALRDTMTNVRTTISGLNVTVNTQIGTITNLINSAGSLQALLLSGNSGTPWNSSVRYGYLQDSRDGQVYRTVTIGTQTWMAQNLNYRNTTGSSDTVGVCYNNSADNCAKYGRLYTWAEAMGVSSAYGTSMLNPTLPAQGLCPNGWHVPTDAEWTSMQSVVDATDATIGTKLKSTSGWITNSGTDAYGYRVLPGGDRSTDGLFYNAGSNANFWTATEIDASKVWDRYFSSDNAGVGRFNNVKACWRSVRCLKN